MDPQQVARIAENIRKMAAGGAAEDEIDDYLSEHEGLTRDAWLDANRAAPTSGFTDEQLDAWQARGSEKPTGKLRGDIREVLQGIFPGADEIEAAIRPGITEEEIAAEREAYKGNFGAGHARGMRGVGMVGGGAALGAATAGIAPTMANFAKIGGSVGAVTGAVESEGSPIQRLLQTIVSSGAGALFGPALVGAGKGLAGAGRMATNLGRRASTAITGELTSGGAAALDRELAGRVMPPGSPRPVPLPGQTAAEALGPEASAINATAIAGMGNKVPERQAIAATVAQRSAQVRQDIQGALTRATGTPWGASGDEIVDAAMATTRQRAARTYTGLYAEMDAAGAATLPKIQTALADANVSQALGLVRSQESQVAIKKGGQALAADAINAELLERTARQLRSTAKLRPEIGGTLSRLADDIDEGLGSVGDLRAVRAEYAKLKTAELAAAGRISAAPGTKNPRRWDAPSVSSADLSRWWRGASAEVRDAMRLRAAADLQRMVDAKLATTSGEAGAARLLDGKMTDKIRTMFPEARADALLRDLRVAETGVDFVKDATRALESAMGTPVGAQAGGSGGAALAGMVGGPGVAMRTGIMEILGRGQNTAAATGAHVAGRLSSPNAPGTIRALDEALSFQDLLARRSGLLNRGLSGIGGVLGGQAGGLLGQRR